MLQTITTDEKVKDDEEALNNEEQEETVRKVSQSHPRKHLAQLASELNDKSYREWSSSSDSSSSIEDVKLHMMNGSQGHVDLKGKLLVSYIQFGCYKCCIVKFKAPTKWALLPLFVVEESVPKDSGRCFEIKKMRRESRLFQRTIRLSMMIRFQLVSH